MKNIIRHIEQYLVKRTGWIYLSMILLASYQAMQSLRGESWSAYLNFFLISVIAYLPTLLFVEYRDWLKQRFSPALFWISWGFCFFLYPIIAFVASAPLSKLLWIGEQSSLSIAIRDYFLLIVGGLLVITELVLRLSDYLRSRFPAAMRQRAIRLDRLLLLPLVLVALGVSFRMAFIGNDEITNTEIISRIPRFFSYSIQFFLLLLGGYFFYYINQHFLIPKLLRKRGLIIYIFGVIASILIFYPLVGLLLRWLPVVYETGLVEPGRGNTFQEIDRLTSEGATPFLIVILSLPFILAVQWFQQSSQIANLEKEKVDTELNLLKEQINPHFFFNTLNNLYALSLTKDPSTPEVILQLSELMRYVIYKGKEATVTLKEEVKYLEDYIELQQIRLHKKLDYRFEKTLTDELAEVPPLLFIILVENAFKHGIEPSEKECFIHISLKQNNNQLQFSIKNSVEEPLDAPPGIGLKNLKRRLELLFPNRYQLDTTSNDNFYQAKLSIEL
jgi:sensor histidine kinase YesM